MENRELAPWISQMMDAAAEAGQLGMLQWLYRHPKNAGYTKDVLEAAVRNDHLATVKWLIKHYGHVAVSLQPVVKVAILKGHYDVVKFLFDRAPQLGLDVAEGIKAVAESGDLNLLQ